MDVGYRSVPKENGEYKEIESVILPLLNIVPSLLLRGDHLLKTEDIHEKKNHLTVRP